MSILGSIQFATRSLTRRLADFLVKKVTFDFFSVCNFFDSSVCHFFFCLISQDEWREGYDTVRFSHPDWGLE